METDLSYNVINDACKKENAQLYKEHNVLLYSSLIFITNVVTAIFNQHYLYSLLFFILTITSLVVHYNDNVYTNIIDKIVILSIVLYGGYVFYKKINTNKWLICLIIILTFIYCLFVYIYGFIVKEYCFCDKKCISQKYHFIMHIIGSIGHHFIIFL